ncbi:stage V sporulation protein AD [Senegalia sp. (in: firmicutes)]|uniref:stage V sporulation protein AD n=2 Tax=Senegalia sp. (in: firmicutes) TaxID=1924098 RepID=UPI003F9D5D4D
MAIKKLGKQTIKFLNPPSIISTATTVGPKEGEGPLKDYFDTIIYDDLYGMGSWEKSEAKIQIETVKQSLKKINLKEDDIEYIFGGDLLNQIIATGFAARDIGAPFFGLYGACSVMSEALSLGAMAVDGGFADKVVCIASSHFSTAERQFRFPLELGNQRPVTSQWTVTGAGVSILSSQGNGPYISHVTTGKIIDKGIIDPNNMGAAMAPAACDTILAHFRESGLKVNDYDYIATGDLGVIGSEILIDMCKKEGLDISKRHTDCGVLIFDNKKQDTHSGGSGCGCSAVVFNGYLHYLLENKEINRILLIATGALHSTTSAQQGESIPCIAHAVTISNNLGGEL